DVTPERVKAFLADRLTQDNRRKGKVKARTANQDAKVLKAAVYLAERDGLVSAAEGLLRPATGRPGREDDEAAARALARPEGARRVEGAGRWYRDVWYAFLVTGVRTAELCALRFEDVDWEQKRLFVRKGKGGRSRWLPIEAGLWEILLTKRQDGRRAGV